jgi:hypothetical protein
VLTAVISAIGAAIGSAIAILITKWLDRKAIWRAKKLAYYEEFLASQSQTVGPTVSPEAKVRFANATNTLHLIGSLGVITALHLYLDQVAESNRSPSGENYDLRLSRLVWEIRADLGDPPTKHPDDFRAISWAPGVGADLQRIPH